MARQRENRPIDGMSVVRPICLR